MSKPKMCKEKLKRVRIKICGLKRAEDVPLCHQFGVDMVGFVTEYPLPVPWNLTAEKTKSFLEEVQPPLKSCLVTGGTCGKIIALAKDLHPHYIQLHYRETLTETEYIAKTLKQFGIGVIKTLPFSPSERLACFGTEELEECVRLLNSTAVDAILADSRGPSNAAKNGTPINISFFRRIKKCAQKPVILAGGITAENLPKILSSAKPEIIDIMTGAESTPGIKDKRKLASIIQQAQGCREMGFSGLGHP
ncbi:MAG: phosphoribosylanthranilate isomerase [Peptococcaceae bacterium]|nr:phosphoribosylanthranilate isomerase [Candidatus Syntrophopropionicum ammoniitolerans]